MNHTSYSQDCEAGLHGCEASMAQMRKGCMSHLYLHHQNKVKTMRLFIAIELEPNIKNALLEIQGNMKKAGVTGNCAISA